MRTPYDAAVHERITSKTPTLRSLIENYCRRSISLAAENESFDSGSLNGGVLPNVVRGFVPCYANEVRCANFGTTRCTTTFAHLKLLS